MSTKLYNVYKLPQNIDLAKLFKIVEVLKSKIYQAQKKQLNQDILELAISMYDHKQYYPTALFYSPKTDMSKEKISVLNLAQKFLIEKQKHQIKENKMDNYYFHINFFFYKNQIYTQARSNNETYRKIFKQVTKATDFEYYDGIDRPKGFTRQQWTQRLKTWEQVFGNDGLSVDKSRNAIKVEFNFKIDYEIYVEDYKLSLNKDIVFGKTRWKELVETIAFSKYDENEIRKKIKNHEFVTFILSKDFLETKAKILDELKEKNTSFLTIEELEKYEVEVIKEFEKPDDLSKNYRLNFF